MSKILDLVKLVCERLFQNEAEKRRLDEGTFSLLIGKVTPDSVLLLHQDLSMATLRDWQIDLFQAIDDFYRLPTSYFHSSRLRGKSDAFVASFLELTDFTEANFSPNEINPDIYRMDHISDPQKYADRAEVLRDLSLKFGKAYMELFAQGQKKNLSGIETIVVVLVLALVAAVFIATILKLLTLVDLGT